MAFILAFIGLGLMVGLAGAGSAIGTAIAGQATLGMIKKKPDGLGIGLVLSAIPGSQGLYGFVGFFLFKGTVTAGLTPLQGAIMLGAGVAVGVACLLSAISQGKVCASGIDAIGNGHNAFGSTMVLAAFPEFYAILSLLSAILLKALMGL